jgi:biopolymer transport protein ExbB
MKRPLISSWLAAFAIAMSATSTFAADDFDAEMKRAVLTYTERLDKANAELNETRQRVEKERAPFMTASRAVEDRIVAAETEISRFENEREQAQEQRRRLLKEGDLLRKNAVYLRTLAVDGLKVFGNGLAPGETQRLDPSFQEVTRGLEAPSDAAATKGAIDGAEYLLRQVTEELGGYTANGRSLVGGAKQLQNGTFAFVGPETFFRAESGAAGVVPRMRTDSNYPITHPLPEWKAERAAAFFAGRDSEFPADATAGRALRLKETTGTFREHLEKGGVVAFAILAVGFLAVGLMILKVRDVARLALDSPETVKQFLTTVAAGDLIGARRKLAGLKPAARELFSDGLEQAEESKETLEEHLQAVLLRLRLQAERRLPLLAVIATASPLMGLLGTVVGMIKTFALITVFGTGNAGKLASGISEVLVATELGLAVAIPTLVIHGFLSQRIHKNLATLERWALQFVTATTKRQVENEVGKAVGL